MTVETLTRAYAAALRLLFALTPALAILYLHFLVPTPQPRFVSHHFHEIAISAAIGLSGFVSYITWRCYQASGEPFLRWLTVGFLGFTLVYLPHGLLTRMADHNIWLFLLYGPASRLVMGACLFYALTRYGAPSENPDAARRGRFLTRAVAIFLGIDILVAILAYSPIASSPWVRLTMEIGALLFSLSGIAVLLWRRIDAPLMAIYAISLASFVQASLSFVLALPWNHQWWLAHAIFAGGFMLLSYGVIQAFHTTRSFSAVYGIEQMMQQLRTSEERFRCVVESSPFPAMLCTDAGEVVFLNPVWAATTGYALEDLPSLHDWEQRTGIPSGTEGDCVVRCRDGSERYWELKSIILPRLSDGLQLTLREANDVTESRRAEARRLTMERQFHEAQKTESLGVLAGGIAHEFNNLLSGILGATELALMKSGTASPISRYLTLVKDSSRRAAALCRQMLAYAGRSQFTPQALDLARLLEEMTDLLRLSVSRTATLELLIPPDLPPIRADKGQLQQVILNLVINASEAIGDTPGHITLAGQFDEAAQQVCLTVSDNGPGVSAETAARMFEPFYTTKFDGRGLGLAAAHGIMAAHGGEIQLLSKPGEGAILGLRFPLA